MRFSETLLSKREQLEVHIKLYNKLQTELFSISNLASNYYSRTCYGEKVQEFLKDGYSLCNAASQEIDRLR